MVQALTQDELKKLDFIVVIDHSGSTGEPSLRFTGKNRLHEMEEACLCVAREAQKYDDDGITVIPFSSKAAVFDGVTADKVRDVFKEFEPRGGTNLALALNEVVNKARASTKDVVAIVYTDGEASDPNEVTATINAAGKEFGRPKIGFTIVQVGQDGNAAKFLDHLDNNLDVDVVATVRAADADDLGIAELAWMARNA